jgi:hypothetical protein
MQLAMLLSLDSLKALLQRHMLVKSAGMLPAGLMCAFCKLTKV